jgi:hypothetical protein
MMDEKPTSNISNFKHPTSNFKTMGKISKDNYQLGFLIC